MLLHRIDKVYNQFKGRALPKAFLESLNTIVQGAQPIVKSLLEMKPNDQVIYRPPDGSSKEPRYSVGDKVKILNDLARDHNGKSVL
jgi:hypothetical protein